MASGLIKLEKGEYLFNEGDPSDAMYVIKSGRIAITKPTQSGEIILAELAPGSMLGEMAFFDNKPRSASAKALQGTVCIALPFKGLHAQFKNFPEWAKAIMRTVNEHLRNANKRIKELEKQNKPETEVFPPYTMNKLISILNYVGMKYGEKTSEGIAIPSERLRKTTIQIFQEPTHKMQKVTEALAKLNICKIEDTGDGYQTITLLKPDLLYQFVDWHNSWLFKKEEERVTIEERELPLITAVLHFAKKQTPSDQGVVKLNLVEVQNDSMRELNTLIKVDDINPLIEKKLLSDKIMETDGLYTSLVLEDLERLYPFWTIIYTLKKYNQTKA